ncbi:MAG: bifunctional methylenetetrahydrofolate dehydrogenase/methenyltetrahydrofolate cyclohydrolase FolD [Magnetococcus sp. WYHC-3]
MRNMMAHIIDGKKISADIRAGLKEEVATLVSSHGVRPGLAVIIAGDDAASHVYVRNKHKACEEVGMASFKHELPATVSEEELLELIARLGADPAVHGILVQLPLPRQINESRVLEAIPPHKDADGFHPYNVGRLVTGSPTFRPCTPWGVMELLRYSHIPVSGMHAVVLGRSNIVGKPVALMLLAAHATVTLCHSRTRDLERQIGMADLLVAAIGKAEYVQGQWLKPGAVVIDVGMNRRPGDGSLCGDVHFASAQAVASAITPVPGGVGPMTITMLLKNAVDGARRAVGAI